MRPAICLTPECGRLRKTRGLCTYCYTKIIRQIQAGSTSWAAQELAGCCLPALTRREQNERHAKNIGMA